MIFKNGERAILGNCGKWSKISGVTVKVVGVVVNVVDEPMQYLIERDDGELWWTGYKVLSIVPSVVNKLFN